MWTAETASLKQMLATDSYFTKHNSRTGISTSEFDVIEKFLGDQLFPTLTFWTKPQNGTVQQQPRQIPAVGVLLQSCESILYLIWITKGCSHAMFCKTALYICFVLETWFGFYCMTFPLNARVMTLAHVFQCFPTNEMQHLQVLQIRVFSLSSFMQNICRRMNVSFFSPGIFRRLNRGPAVLLPKRKIYSWRSSRWLLDRKPRVPTKNVCVCVVLGVSTCGVGVGGWVSHVKKPCVWF